MGSQDWRAFVYGGLAAVTAEFCTFPIDTTKTRLQVQGQAGDSKLAGLKYKGMIDAMVRISKEEGVSALYSGVWPAALRQAVYGTLKFGTYYSLKRFITDNEIFGKKSETGRESVGVNVLCAALAGAISSAIANPTDVLKVRLQVKGKGGPNVFRMFGEIYDQEGLKGLWRGVGPTAQRAVIITAVGLPLYDSCKRALKDHLGDTVVNHTMQVARKFVSRTILLNISLFSSSFLSSVASAIASCPIDVVRTRLMNQKVVKQPGKNSSGPRLYKGSIDCAIYTIKHEGFMALYKGFIPTLMRMGPWNITFFITYEALKKLY